MIQILNCYEKNIFNLSFYFLSLFFLIDLFFINCWRNTLKKDISNILEAGKGDNFKIL